MGGTSSYSFSLVGTLLYSRVYSLQYGRSDVLQPGAHHPGAALGRDGHERHVDDRNVQEAVFRQSSEAGGKGEEAIKAL